MGKVTVLLDDLTTHGFVERHGKMNLDVRLSRAGHGSHISHYFNRRFDQRALSEQDELGNRLGDGPRIEKVVKRDGQLTGLFDRNCYVVAIVLAHTLEI